MKLKLIFLLFGIFHLSFATITQPLGAFESQKDILTLEESVSEALTTFSSVKVKEEAINEAINTKKKTRADLLPEFSTSYGYTRLGDPHRIENLSLPGSGLPPIPRFEFDTEKNYQWKVSVKQPLFTGFALISAYKLAKLGIDISRLELEVEKLDLALRVKEAYFSVLRTNKTLDVAEKAKAQLESHVSEVRDFFEAGIIPENDLLKAEVELGISQHNLTKAENFQKFAQSSFNTLLSRPINEAVEIEDILEYKASATDFDESLKKALQNRPEISIIDTKLRQTKKQIKLAKSKYYPQVALTADYIKEGDSPDVSGSDFHLPDSWQAMVGLNWTFWQWGKTHYSVNEKHSQKRQLIHAKSGIEDSIRLEVKEAILKLNTAEKNIPITKKAVLQAEENLRVSNERYQSQLTTTTEVLDAQTLLTQARMNFYNSLYDYFFAKAKLQHSIGEF